MLVRSPGDYLGAGAVLLDVPSPAGSDANSQSRVTEPNRITGHPLGVHKEQENWLVWGQVTHLVARREALGVEKKKRVFLCTLSLDSAGSEVGNWGLQSSRMMQWDEAVT